MKKTIIRSIERELGIFVRKKIKAYKFKRIDALLGSFITEFVERGGGKRIRPGLFILSYLGFSKQASLKKDILRASLAFELLHDFLLIHDDIIDNSPTRRGKPTMHIMFQRALRQSDKIAKDLSMLAGDILYAMAVEAFLCLQVKPQRKEYALKIFLNSTVLTGAGEYKDILNGLVSMKKITLNDIRLNYLLKTAEYTFKAPLACAAAAAGAAKKDIARISRYAELIGEAFQIQDDMIGLFETSKKIGKSVLSDIIEAKKTLPLYLAYKKASVAQRSFIEASLSNQNLTFSDLKKIRGVIKNTGAYELTRKKISTLLQQADALLEKTAMRNKYKQAIRGFVAFCIQNDNKP